MVVSKRVVEQLRPLIEAQQWDYCVVWKLGDDLSRFIEWMGCCCGGGYGKANVKEEKIEDSLSNFCRDTCWKHPVKSKACKALSKLPNSMPLYSGIHTEVVLSTEPMWLNKVDACDSNPFHDLSGTQVLIPVVGGVIELYSWKHIPKDQSVIDFVKGHCNVDLNVNARSSDLESLLEDSKHNSSSSLHLLSCHPVTQCSSYNSIDGSSGSSNPSNGHGMLNLNCDSSQREPFTQSIKRCSGPYNVDILKKQAVLVSGCGISADNKKVNRKKEKGIYQAKNLLTERNRRGRIKGGLYHLRSLVPKITKMDMASIIGDAIDYMHELQAEIKELQDELRDMEEEDCQVNKAEFKVFKSKTINGDTSCSPTTNQNKSSSPFEAGNQTEVQVEVNEIGRRCCFVRLLCDQERGGFGRLLEALDSLGLHVVTANVTTLNGKVQNIIEVEANMDIQPKRLRDSLIKLTF